MRRISGISWDEEGCPRDSAWAVMERISVLERASLVSRHWGLPVARKWVRDGHVAQRGGHFELDDGLLVDDRVGGIFTDDYVTVRGHESPLLRDL